MFVTKVRKYATRNAEQEEIKEIKRKVKVIVMHSTKDLAFMIRKLAKEQGMSGIKVLKACNINRNFLYDLEHSDTSPSIDKIDKIADFFGVSIDYLMKIDSYRKPVTPGMAHFLEYYEQLNIEERKNLLYLVKTTIFAAEAEKDLELLEEETEKSSDRSTEKVRISHSHIPLTRVAAKSGNEYATAPTLDEAILIAKKMRNK